MTYDFCVGKLKFTMDFTDGTCIRHKIKISQIKYKTTLTI